MMKIMIRPSHIQILNKLEEMRRSEQSFASTWGKGKAIFQLSLGKKASTSCLLADSIHSTG